MLVDFLFDLRVSKILTKKWAERLTFLPYCTVKLLEFLRVSKFLDKSKRPYIEERAGSRSVGRPLKIWIDTMKECLRKRGLDIRQARTMVQDRSEW